MILQYKIFSSNDFFNIDESISSVQTLTSNIDLININIKNNVFTNNIKQINTYYYTYLYTITINKSPIQITNSNPNNNIFENNSIIFKPDLNLINDKNLYTDYIPINDFIYAYDVKSIVKTYLKELEYLYLNN